MHRRDFLTSVAASALAATALRADETPMDPVIDVHTHFYDPTRPEGVPWPSKDDKVLYRPVLPAEFQKLTSPLGVISTVVVEASNRPEDNQWVLDLVAKNKVLAGLVGHLTPGEEGFARHLERFSQNPKFYGIRIGEDTLRKSLSCKDCLEDLERMAARSLALDVNGGPEMLSDVAALAKVLPRLTIVINHLANVAIDGKTPPQAWREGMVEAGKYPNVSCKVSALVEGAARNGKKAPTDPEFYKPVLDVTWNAFGGERLMFGSDWPVSDRAADYATILQLARSDVAGRKADAKAFFAGNARRIYGIKE